MNPHNKTFSAGPVHDAGAEIWREIRARGIVQGVGFRPAVWRHATTHGLRGSVRNTLGGVVIVVGGAPEPVGRFEATLGDALPSVARVESLESRDCEPVACDGFIIAASAAEDTADAVIPPDLSVCDACLAEIGSASDRRGGYAFTACAQCGPRYTIVEGLPYDRERTAMREFPLCPACREEYENPADRRYHAECSSCPECGPALTLLLPDEPPVRGGTALERAVALLRQGCVGAIKGIGGYHLVCDATNSIPIEALRRRKRRPAKPFALMSASTEAVGRHAMVSAAERELLESPERPIVLLKKHSDAALPESIAPGNQRLGFMLPYTPLHHLLLEPFEALVMTSANESEEPIMHTEEEIAPWLGTVVDFVLSHNRRIWNKCDDSVAVVQSRQPTLVRRARGFAPSPIRLTRECPPLLACGADLKNVFALARGRNAYLSTHMGDLENVAAMENYRRQIERWTNLLGVRPECVVHDLHPGYHSTQYALSLPFDRKIAVQHHHAHLASVLADGGWEGRAIGVIFDGTGYGDDGTVWGGEFLVGDATGFERAAWLKPVALPGADKAVFEPWRMALSALMDAVGLETALAVVQPRMAKEPQRAEALAGAIATRAPFPMTSSAGRLFDALGFLLGGGDEAKFEAQHAMFAEALASPHFNVGAYSFTFIEQSNGIAVDLSPMWQEIVGDLERGVEPGRIASRFHAGLIEMIVMACEALRERTGLRAAACSGGVFLNTILAEGTRRRLEERGFTTLFHRRVPPGDGGIALGQAEIAAAILGMDRSG